MLIQNIGGTAPVQGFATNGVPVPVAAPSTQSAPVETPQVVSKSAQHAQPTEAQLKSAVDSINNTMKQNNSNVEFSIEKGSDQSIVKVVDTQTGQVISQFPSKAAIAVSQMVAQSLPGALVRQEA